MTGVGGPSGGGDSGRGGGSGDGGVGKDSFEIEGENKNGKAGMVKKKLLRHKADTRPIDKPTIKRNK